MSNRLIFDVRTGSSKYESVEYTPEELAINQSVVRRAEVLSKHRPMTAEDVYGLMVAQQINSLVVDSNTALRMKKFYPNFESVVGQTVNKGFKFTHEEKLWEVIQPSLTIQSHYAPGAGTESLYAEVCEMHEGTEDDPIPYSGNMALEQGKYYMQEDEIYRCIRNTGNPVYHTLKDLIGLYVELM